MSNAFENVGIQDAVLGAELFDAMRVSVDDVVFPKDQMQMEAIASFVSEFEDGMGLIRAVAMKKPPEVDMLEHVTRYVSLQKKRMAIRQELSKLEEELSLFE